MDNNADRLCSQAEVAPGFPRFARIPISSGIPIKIYLALEFLIATIGSVESMVCTCSPIFISSALTEKNFSNSFAL